MDASSAKKFFLLESFSVCTTLGRTCSWYAYALIEVLLSIGEIDRGLSRENFPFRLHSATGFCKTVRGADDFVKLHSRESEGVLWLIYRFGIYRVV